MRRKSKKDSTYPWNWLEISKQAKDAVGWKCIRCGHENDYSTGHVLTVHHLDLDPNNNAWWNLAVLCQRCHLKIQAKVIIERPYMFEHSEWFRPYVAGYYARIHSHPDTREWVMEHLDALLEYGRPPFTSTLDEEVQS